MGKTGAAFLAFLFAAASAASAQSGPVGYWKGDDGASPATAADSSGAGNNGTYTGGATTSTNVPTLQFPNTRSMSFSTASTIVNIPAFSWPSGGPVTVAYWSYVTAAQVRNSSSWRMGGTDAPNRFHTHAPWGDNNLYWDYGDYNNPGGRISTSYAGFTDKWTHIAVVSTGNGGNLKAIYLDGVLRNSATNSDGPDIALTGLVLGQWNTTYYHQGLIDDFRIYDRVLPAADIARLAAGQTEPPAPTGLTATPALGQITLNWNAVPGVVGYNLKKSSLAGQSTFALTGTSYTDTAVTSAWPWTYTYTVSAILISEGPDSAPVTASPTPPPPRTSKVGGENNPCGCGSTVVPSPAVLAAALGFLALAVALSRRR